tara:strand:+ start:985 stop:1581 length:597 start_codon:yes stop_codon:yes gene_type:complete
MNKVILTVSTILLALTSCDKPNDDFLLEKNQEALQGMYDQYDSVVDYKNELEASLADALDQILSLTIENDSLKGLVSDLQDLNDSFVIALDDAYALNAQLTSDLAVSQADLAESDSLLSDALLLAGALQSELDDAYSEISDLNSEISGLNASLSSSQSINDTLSARIDTLKNRIVEKNKRIVKLRKRIQDLKSNYPVK